MVYQKKITIQTRAKSTHDITDEVEQVLSQADISQGLCHVFLRHTSASLILCENTDPDVRKDLEAFTQEWCPDGNPMFSHQAEGPDDMPAHIRTVFTHNDLTIPFSSGQLLLGTWQGVYLWEHRAHGYRRSIIVTIL